MKRTNLPVAGACRLPLGLRRQPHGSAQSLSQQRPVGLVRPEPNQRLGLCRRTRLWPIGRRGASHRLASDGQADGDDRGRGSRRDTSRRHCPRSVSRQRRDPDGLRADRAAMPASNSTRSTATSSLVAGNGVRPATIPKGCGRKPASHRCAAPAQFTGASPKLTRAAGHPPSCAARSLGRDGGPRVAPEAMLCSSPGRVLEERSASERRGRGLLRDGLARARSVQRMVS